jgi:hypothetical protein
MRLVALGAGHKLFVQLAGKSAAKWQLGVNLKNIWPLRVPIPLSIPLFQFYRPPQGRGTMFDFATKPDFSSGPLLALLLVGFLHRYCA